MWKLEDQIDCLPWKFNRVHSATVLDGCAPGINNNNNNNNKKCISNKPNPSMTIHMCEAESAISIHEYYNNTPNNHQPLKRSAKEERQVQHPIPVRGLE